MANPVLLNAFVSGVPDGFNARSVVGSKENEMRVWLGPLLSG